MTAGMCKFSGGCIYHLPLFRVNTAQNADYLSRILVRYLTRKIGFEAVMRIRCTRGLSIHTFHGNFFVRSTDLLSLPNVNPDAGFGMQISIEESLSDTQTVCFQAALLYTSSKGMLYYYYYTLLMLHYILLKKCHWFQKLIFICTNKNISCYWFYLLTISGERRIRVHTLCLPVASNLSEILHSADQQCIAGLLAKMGELHFQFFIQTFNNNKYKQINDNNKMTTNQGVLMTSLRVCNCIFERNLKIYIYICRCTRVVW